MEFLYRHAKNFVADKKSKNPVLRGICFTGKTAVMSNGHVLFMVKDYPSPKRIVEPKTGREITGDYPNISNVIPKNFLTEITFFEYLAQWQRCFKICAEITKNVDEHSCIQLVLDNTGLCVRAANPNLEMISECKLPTEKFTERKTLISYYNAVYILSILTLFKDIGNTSLVLKLTETVAVFESEKAIALVCGITSSGVKRGYGYVAD